MKKIFWRKIEHPEGETQPPVSEEAVPMETMDQWIEKIGLLPVDITQIFVPGNGTIEFDYKPRKENS